MSHILEVTNLEVEFSGDGGKNISVDHVGFHVDSGEIVCIVGGNKAHWLLPPTVPYPVQ